MLKHRLLKVIYIVQVLIYKLALLFYSIRFYRKDKSGVVVGTEEIASILYSIGDSLSNSTTVNSVINPYYDYNYDYDLGRFKVLRYVLLPIIFAKLIRTHNVFIYVGGCGFFLSEVDGRSFEFSQLKKHGNKIITYFTGSEIRSFNLLNSYAKKRNIDVITTYQSISHRGIDLPYRENVRRKLASSAQLYSDAVFNPAVDQMTYIDRSTHPFLYFTDNNKVNYFPKKWQKPEKLVVVHAPSSPIIKGTPLVRAAIKKLQLEGYDFEYVELIGVPNLVVISELKRAHIILNEFYAFVPGVFGVEAMSNNAVLLCSADKNIEPTLFDGANEAWVVTPYWLIYDNLKNLLNSPVTELHNQANRGTAWVSHYCTYTYSSNYLNEVIKGVNND